MPSIFHLSLKGIITFTSVGTREENGHSTVYIAILSLKLWTVLVNQRSCKHQLKPFNPWILSAPVTSTASSNRSCGLLHFPHGTVVTVKISSGFLHVRSSVFSGISWWSELPLEKTTTSQYWSVSSLFLGKFQFLLCFNCYNFSNTVQLRLKNDEFYQWHSRRCC